MIPMISYQHLMSSENRLGNVTSTRLPWQSVWTPDIVLYNAAGDGDQGRELRTLIQVVVFNSVKQERFLIRTLPKVVIGFAKAQKMLPRSTTGVM